MKSSPHPLKTGRHTPLPIKFMVLNSPITDLSGRTITLDKIENSNTPSQEASISNFYTLKPHETTESST